MPVSSQPGVPQSGKISWFGGPHDPSAGGAPASGLGWIPGISTYNHATLGGYWLVHMPNGKQAVLRQTDIGPAPWTGRNFDFTYNALPQLGYHEGNFPTDANIQATYLGKSVPQQYAHLNVSGGGSAGSGPGGAPPGSPPGLKVVPGQELSLPIQQFDQAGFNKAQNAYKVGTFLSHSSNPFDAANAKGAQGFGGGGSDLLFKGGLATTTPPNPADFQSTKMLKLAQNTLQEIGGSGLKTHPGALSNGKYVNPLPGFSLGRTDMGVDASARPGTPIRAIGDSKIIGVGTNWYGHGNPGGGYYILAQLLNGPKAGQYYYVAEQVNPAVRPGQIVHAGEPVGHFASSGTGIEIGWGSPTVGRTQAQATTGYHEGQVTPAGSSFRNLLGSLGAR